MRFLIVHAHFYQPPRENPWTEVIERQASATPYHDWNERITDECYQRLGAAAVPGPRDKRVALINLFARISFNIGPTLSTWFEQHRPSVLRDAIEGESEAYRRSGSSPALMQPYSHPILPLCNEQEKRLQLAWGKADYQRRFGRDPEGIWLPECAVDLETLEAAATAGLRYTIVAPEQIRRIRPLDQEQWQDTSHGQVDTSKPLTIKLPSGKTFSLFVFENDLSRGVAFGSALESGAKMLSAVQDAFERKGEDALVLLAADGETYGHHQQGAEESLADGLMRVRSTGLARVTHLGEVLRKIEPSHEAEIVTPSSWSCRHGIDRWQKECDCLSADRPEKWSTAWRLELRNAMTSLRDRLFALVDRRGGEFFSDPWRALEEYGEVLVHPPSNERREAFLEDHALSGLDDDKRRRACMTAQMVHQMLAATTSCGWFFDDLAGIEAIQVIKHAARACELAESTFDVAVQSDFLHRLERAHSQREDRATGARIFLDESLPARRDHRHAMIVHVLASFSRCLLHAESPAASSSRHGCYAVNDTVEPQFESADEEHSFKGKVEVVQLRNGSRYENDFLLTMSRPLGPITLVAGGAAIDLQSPLAGEHMLKVIAACAIQDMSKQADPEKTAEIDRLVELAATARKLGVSLPSPLIESVRGRARLLITALIERSPTSLEQDLEEMQAALDALLHADIASEDLLDTRPAVERRLAYMLSAQLSRKNEAQAMIEILGKASRIFGERVLGRARRVLVDPQSRVLRARREVFAEATGLTLDALTPLDGPVHHTNEDARDAFA